MTRHLANHAAPAASLALRLQRLIAEGDGDLAEAAWAAGVGVLLG